MSDPRVQVYLESLEIDVKAGHIRPAWFPMVSTCHFALFLHFCPGDFCTVSFVIQRWLAQRCQCFLWFGPWIILKMIDGRCHVLRNDIEPAIALWRIPKKHLHIWQKTSKSLMPVLIAQMHIASCLSSGEGVISCDDFIEGILRCKGPARAIDQHLVQVKNLSWPYSMQLAAGPTAFHAGGMFSTEDMGKISFKNFQNGSCFVRSRFARHQVPTPNGMVSIP